MEPVLTVSIVILLSGFTFFICFFLSKVIKILFDGSLEDFSKPIGNPIAGALYSLIKGMSPFKKETAYLHWPTYSAGILYHLGSFLSLLWLPILFLKINMPGFIIRFSIYYLPLSIICGILILLKRMANQKLRFLSCPDDYVSNVLATLFQIFTALSLYHISFIPLLYFCAGVLFFYIPIGKLRHIVYFVTTRIHLGYHFGKRGTWPTGRSQQ